MTADRTSGTVRRAFGLPDQELHAAIMSRPRIGISVQHVETSLAGGSSAGDLLDLYLSMGCAERDHRFSCTMRAAEITGLSVRTIQFWIECGYVQALYIGRKYRVDLDSLRLHLKTQMAKHDAA